MNWMFLLAILSTIAFLCAWFTCLIKDQSKIITDNIKGVRYDVQDLRETVISFRKDMERNTAEAVKTRKKAGRPKGSTRRKGI